MNDKVNKPPKLFKYLKDYEGSTNEEKGLDLFGKSYELVLNCLDKKKDSVIQESLNYAIENDEELLYENIYSITLTTIHHFSYTQDDKEYYSTLLVVPYFTITEDDSSDSIHYPPAKDIEAVFKKHFFNAGLINDPSELHLPGIKITADIAYTMNFSDWFELHKAALSKSLHPELDDYYLTDISIPIPQGGDLSFFPILITHEDNELIAQPAICDNERTDFPIDLILESIEKDVQILSGTGIWALGVPSHCENALDFGLEIQQDFSLDLFLKSFIQRENIEFAFFPLTDTYALVAWNCDTMEIESVIDISPYSLSDEEFVDEIIEQIAFHDISKTYIFDEDIGYYDVENLHGFDLSELIETYNVVLLETTRSTKPTFH